MGLLPYEKGGLFHPYFDLFWHQNSPKYGLENPGCTLLKFTRYIGRSGRW
jgi:hypothetical protein